MILYDDIQVCVIGLFLGAVYGFLFIRNSENAPSLYKNRFLTALFKIPFSLVRIGLIGILAVTILHRSLLMIILATASFLMGFWAIIISKKVRRNEQP
jgi:hypothetical protein